MVGFPLLLIPLALYNIVVFLMPGVSFADTLFKIPMLSGTEWPVTLSDVLIALGIVLLLLEVVKGARPGAKYLTDHLLSLVIFGAAAAEFVLWPKFANSTFFLLTLLAMVDFLSGVSLRTRRRAIVADAAPVSHKSRRHFEAPAAEPEFEPAPMPQPAPRQASPAAATPRPAAEQPASSEDHSPHLQPNNGTTRPVPDGSQH